MYLFIIILTQLKIVLHHISNLWSLVSVLYASKGYSYDAFGASIAMSSKGTQVLIGSPSANRTDVTTKSGSAYLFEINEDGNWVESAILTQNLSHTIPNEFDGCGSSVAYANGDKGVFVGATFADDDAGAVYYFGNLDNFRTDGAATSGTASTGSAAFNSKKMQGDSGKISSLDLFLLLGVAFPATIGVVLYLLSDDYKTQAIQRIRDRVQQCFGHRYGKLDDSVSLMRHSNSTSTSQSLGKSKRTKKMVITLDMSDGDLNLGHNSDDQNS